LTFSAIAKQESIAVTPDEFQREVENVAKERGMEEKALMRQLANTPEALQALTDSILSEKIVEFLMSRAEIKFVPDTSSQDASVQEPLSVASKLEKEEFEVLAED